MVKIRLLNIYKTEDIPDHVIEELKAHIMNIFTAITPITEGVSSNLNISAMNHVMAMMVKIYISEDPEEIKRAARNLAYGFLGNVKFYTGVDPMEIEE